MNFSEEQRQPLKSGSSLPRSFRAAAPQGLKISGLLVSRPSVVELIPAQRPRLSFGATCCLARRFSLPVLLSLFATFASANVSPTAARIAAAAAVAAVAHSSTAVAADATAAAATTAVAADATAAAASTAVAAWTWALLFLNPSVHRTHPPCAGSAAIVLNPPRCSDK